MVFKTYSQGCGLEKATHGSPALQTLAACRVMQESYFGSPQHNEPYLPLLYTPHSAELLLETSDNGVLANLSRN